ncbi:hypothetical protein [Pseudomonas sp. efr-133-TYG-103a]|uniref:hypothetical protein n=1 Tax=Pseudomonas sp. efr-133-TYG-103a TaxID=3040308 RepID=UPI00255521C5|nr:hypothetical protein [Pseudomonas sp. efr-133-TYG-103a]
MMNPDGYLDYERWANKRRNDPTLFFDACKAAQWTPPEREAEPEAVPREAATKKHATASPQRGRPKKNTTNPVAHHMSLLSFERPHWLDGIIYGATATAAGVSAGKLNVRLGSVIAAMHLKNISTAAVKNPMISERTAQTIAKASRHAIHGVVCYLDRHPATKSKLDLELSYELAAD